MNAVWMSAMNPLDIGGTSSALNLRTRSKRAGQGECTPVIGDGVTVRDVMF
jgi:hypothetical protein